MELDQIVLDTSAYSAYKRGHTEIVDVIKSASSILIPSIVIGELLSGFDLGNRSLENRQEFDEFLSSIRVHEATIRRETSERYSHIYRYLRKIGRPIPTNDLWIAAVTMEYGATLLTTDAHFDGLPQIMIAYYSV